MPAQSPVYADFDDDREVWVTPLTGDGPAHRDVLDRLHALLLRAAHRETHRRAGSLRLVGPELEDIAHQAADDALVAITAKIDRFRGDSRFTTWAYKFVILEVASKINRHHWQRREAVLDDLGWDRLPAKFGMEPDARAEWNELMASLRRAVQQRLTPRQRDMFLAIVVDGVPLDVLVEQTGSNRNAIYKMIFDARRKIRAALVADGHIRDDKRSDPPADPAAASTRSQAPRN